MLAIGIMAFHLACGGVQEKSAAVVAPGTVTPITVRSGEFTAANLTATGDGLLIFKGTRMGNAQTDSHFLGSIQADLSVKVLPEGLSTQIGAPIAALGASIDGRLWVGWEQPEPQASDPSNPARTVVRGLAQLGMDAGVISQKMFTSADPMGLGLDCGSLQHAFSAPDGSLFVPGIVTSEAGQQALQVERFDPAYGHTRTTLDSTVARTGTEEGSGFALGDHLFMDGTLYLLGRTNRIYVVPPVALQDQGPSAKSLWLPETALYLAAGPDKTLKVLTASHSLQTFTQMGKLVASLPLPALAGVQFAHGPNAQRMFANGQGLWIVGDDRLVHVSPQQVVSEYPLAQPTQWASLAWGPGGDLYGLFARSEGASGIARISVAHE